MVHHPILDEVVDAEGHILVVGLLNNLENLLPVARLQRRVRELLEEGHVFLETVDLVLEPVDHAVVLVRLQETV